MTDEQQRRMADTLIPKIEKLLMEAKLANSSGKIDKLKAIRDLIDEETAVREMPQEWMKYFGTAGLRSLTTVLACGWFRDGAYSRWSKHRNELQLIYETRRVFKNREVGKHAEIEMLEWLTSSDVPAGARELWIAVSRSPCQDCLDKIISFVQSLPLHIRNKIKIRIGFAHWYHKNINCTKSCSSAKQMSTSLDYVIKYTVLTRSEIKTIPWSDLFEPNNLKHLSTFVPENDRRIVLQDAWKHFGEHEQKEESKGCVHFLFDRNKMKKCIACKKKQADLKQRRILGLHKLTVGTMLKVFGDQCGFWEWLTLKPYQSRQKCTDVDNLSYRIHRIDL